MSGYAAPMLPATWRTRIWTVPNVISLVRLACIPLFLSLMLVSEDILAAALLLAVLGATDWVDGWIARRFDQGSELGKVLDPAADRLLLLSAVVAVMIGDYVPLWLGIVILVREGLVVVGTLILAGAGARRIEVTWAGKAGTFDLMFALPAFVFASLASGVLHTLLFVFAWGCAIGGLILSWYAFGQYVLAARTALREGRSARVGEHA